MSHKPIFLFFVLLFLAPVIYCQEIKVMTFNIYHGEENYDRGKSNIQRVAAIINQYQPDFVALQEVDSMTNRSAKINSGKHQDFMQELAKLTGMKGFFAKAIDFSNGGYGEGLLSRHHVSIKKYTLPTPKGGEGRALIEATYQLPNKKKIIFAGTHLCHEFEENTLAQAQQIIDIYKNTRTPVIIGGDWNFIPASPGYEKMTEGFTDAALQHGKPENTFSYDNPTERIDFIFLSKNKKWTIKKVQVIQENPSDHLPLLITLKL